MKILWMTFLCLPLFLRASPLPLKDYILLKEHIRDFNGAIALIKQDDPWQRQVKKISLLLQKGAFASAQQLWMQQRYRIPKTHPLYRKTLRELCWGKLREGFNKGNLETKGLCLIAAALQGQGESLPFLLEALHAKNQYLRKLVLHFSVFYFDRLIWEELYELYRSPPSEEEGVLLIQSLEKNQHPQHIPFLKYHLALEQNTLPFRKAVLQVLASLLGPQLSDLQELVNLQDPMIQFFFQVLRVKYSYEPVDESSVIKLMEQPDEELRVKLLQSLCQRWDYQPSSTCIEKMQQIKHSSLPLFLSICQFLVVKTHSSKAQQLLLSACVDEQQDKRLLACSHILACGPYMVEPLLKAWKKQWEKDPYVLATLTHYLFSQNVNPELLPTICESFLKQTLASPSFQPLIHSYSPASFPCFVPYGTKNQGMDKTYSIQASKIQWLKSSLPYYPQASREAFEKLLAQLSSKHIQSVMTFSLGENIYQKENFPEELLQLEGRELSFEKALLGVVIKKSLIHARYLKENYASYDDKKKARVLEVWGVFAGEESWDFLSKDMFDGYGEASYIAASSLLQALNR